MTKASDNAFPSILITEGTEPSAPAAGKQRLYIDSTSHHLMRTNSSGTETDIEGGSAAAFTAHGCRVKRSADVSVGNNTYTVIPFTAEDHDTDTMHDNSTNNSRITIPSISGVTTGLWEVRSFGYTNQTGTGRTDVQIRMNAAGAVGSGTGIGFGSTNQVGTVAIQGYLAACQYVFSATDYVETFVRTTGGSHSVIFDAGFSPIFEVAFLGKVT
jgi:hypothetical protein